VLDGKGQRAQDMVKHTLDYIEIVGSKVAERKKYVEEHQSFTRESKTYLEVQMKPHEPQKYKKGKLKFGRMVASITGQGWLDANPTVWYDKKHALEIPLTVRNVGTTEFSISIME